VHSAALERLRLAPEGRVGSAEPPDARDAVDAVTDLPIIAADAGEYPVLGVRFRLLGPDGHQHEYADQ
jgi:hypothetical protein